MCAVLYEALKQHSNKMFRTIRSITIGEIYAVSVHLYIIYKEVRKECLLVRDIPHLFFRFIQGTQI